MHGDLRHQKRMGAAEQQQHAPRSCGPQTVCHFKTHAVIMRQQDVPSERVVLLSVNGRAINGSVRGTDL